MSDAQLQAEIARLTAENNAMKVRQKKAVFLKVSEKGAVSLYGLGRFPVSLYKEQWEAILDCAEDIRSFIEEHKSELKTKNA